VKQKTLGELAELTNGRLVGDAETVITGVAGARNARRGDITFAANLRYARYLTGSEASAAVIGPGLEAPNGMPLIRVDDAEAAFSRIAEVFLELPATFKKGVIHPTAVIADDVTLGVDVGIGAHVVVESGSRIGDRTVLRPLVYVGQNVVIGSDCLLHPNVTVRERVTVGDRCILHSGAVIGGDGFGYDTREGRHHKIPQLGTVLIEDDVEIGSGTTIDRARFDRTWIKRGTKIDNLVQVGHNVVIGENCMIVAMVGLCGSAYLGRNVTLAGKASVNGHVSLGNNVMVGGLAGVTRDVPDGMWVSGFPAQVHQEELRLAARLRRVPELFRRVKELETKLREIEHTTDDDR